MATASNLGMRHRPSFWEQGQQGRAGGGIHDTANTGDRIGVPQEESRSHPRRLLNGPPASRAPPACCVRSHTPREYTGRMLPAARTSGIQPTRACSPPARFASTLQRPFRQHAVAAQTSARRRDENRPLQAAHRQPRTHPEPRRCSAAGIKLISRVRSGFPIVPPAPPAPPLSPEMEAIPPFGPRRVAVRWPPRGQAAHVAKAMSLGKGQVVRHHDPERLRHLARAATSRGDSSPLVKIGSNRSVPSLAQ